MNLNTTRVKVGCINWSYDDAPHAVVYLWDGTEAGANTYCDTWAEALKVANTWATVLRARRLRVLLREASA